MIFDHQHCWVQGIPAGLRQTTAKKAVTTRTQAKQEPQEPQEGCEQAKHTGSNVNPWAKIGHNSLFPPYIISCALAMRLALLHLTMFHSSIWFTWKVQQTTVNNIDYDKAWGPWSMRSHAMAFSALPSCTWQRSLDNVSLIHLIHKKVSMNNSEHDTCMQSLLCALGQLQGLCEETHRSHRPHGNAAWPHPHSCRHRSTMRRLQLALAIDVALHCLIMLIVKWHGRSTMHTTRVTHITSGSLIWPSYNGSARAWTSWARTSCSPSAYGTWLKSAVKQNLFS